MRPGPALLAPFSLLLFVLTAEGCGYSLVRYRNADGETRRVAIRTLENDSSVPDVEVLVAQALRREFLGRGGTRLVDNPEQADLVIRGRIPFIKSRARSFSSVVLALEYEVTLTLDLRFESRNGQGLGDERVEFSESDLYQASADVEVMRKNRQEVLRRLAGLLAGRVHDAVDQSQTPDRRAKGGPATAPAAPESQSQKPAEPSE